MTSRSGSRTPEITLRPEGFTDVQKWSAVLGLIFGLLLAFWVNDVSGLRFESVGTTILVLGQGGILAAVFTLWERDTIRKVRVTPSGVTFSYYLHEVIALWRNLGPTQMNPDHGRWPIRDSSSGTRKVRYHYVPVAIAEVITKYPAHEPWSVPDALANLFTVLPPPDFGPHGGATASMSVSDSVRVAPIVSEFELSSRLLICALIFLLIAGVAGAVATERRFADLVELEIALVVTGAAMGVCFLILRTWVLWNSKRTSKRKQ
jgi:hypothetical protein